MQYTAINYYWYKEYKTVAGDWAMEVIRGVIPIGNIRKNDSTGRYEFFKGPVTVVVPLYKTFDLNTVQLMIRTKQP